MKIKSFECPKSIRNYEKKNIGMSDAWSMSRLSHRPSEPVNYIADCRILRSLVVKLLIDNIFIETLGLKEGLQTTFVNLLECIINASVISTNDHTIR